MTINNDFVTWPISSGVPLPSPRIAFFCYPTTHVFFSCHPGHVLPLRCSTSRVQNNSWPLANFQPLFLHMANQSHEDLENGPPSQISYFALCATTLSWFALSSSPKSLLHGTDIITAIQLDFHLWVCCSAHDREPVELNGSSPHQWSHPLSRCKPESFKEYQPPTDQVHDVCHVIA